MSVPATPLAASGRTPIPDLRVCGLPVVAITPMPEMETMPPHFLVVLDKGGEFAVARVRRLDDRQWWWARYVEEYHLALRRFAELAVYAHGGDA